MLVEFPYKYSERGHVYWFSEQFILRLDLGSRLGLQFGVRIKVRIRVWVSYGL
jgi:hypothetical protein